MSNMQGISAIVFTVIIFTSRSAPVNGGIHGFHKWFQSEFPTAVTTLKRGDVVEVDHLLFDLNQLLHKVLSFPLCMLKLPLFATRPRGKKFLAPNC